MSSRFTEHFSFGAKATGLLLAASLTACGGDSDKSASVPTNTDVSVRFSDAPVEDAARVVITVDTLTFERAGGEDIVVETFTSEELGITDAETFQLDLLEVQGNDSRLVLDSVQLPAGEYRNLRITVVDEDVNFSFVEEVSTGLLKPIKVPSDELKLGRFQVATTGTQTFVVEFGLRQALVYNPGPDRYILKPRGVRIVDLSAAASLAGAVDLFELHEAAACGDKSDISLGNVLYLYPGRNLDPSKLGDVFVRESEAEPGDTAFDADVPADVLAPVAVVQVAESQYLFSWLESGDYTLALSCLAEGDDPVTFDGITIPAPDTELVEVTLGIGEEKVCDFPLVDGACANEAGP